jgi:hypothetical protein
MESELGICHHQLGRLRSCGLIGEHEGSAPRSESQPLATCTAKATLALASTRRLLFHAATPEASPLLTVVESDLTRLLVRLSMDSCYRQGASAASHNAPITVTTLPVDGSSQTASLSPEFRGKQSPAVRRPLQELIAGQFVLNC